VLQIPRTRPDLRLPHVGWNDLLLQAESPLFEGLGAERNAYFVHSFHFVVADPAHCLATVDYGGPVTASVAKDNVFGCQFHPEKSQQVGLSILRNFARMERC
jgi:glutamine amidotransferase